MDAAIKPLSVWASLREGNERFVNHASMPSTTELFRTASPAVWSSVILMGSNEGLFTVDELEGRHVVETGSLIMQRTRIIADKVDKSACTIGGVTYTLSDGHMRVQGTVGDIGSI